MQRDKKTTLTSSKNDNLRRHINSYPDGFYSVPLVQTQNPMVGICHTSWMFFFIYYPDETWN